MAKYILAHDLGTSGNKATLFSEDGQLIGSKVTSYETHYFNDTWVEQDANQWWQAVCTSTKQLLQTSNIAPENIGAVSFSGQMMGCLCVDKKGVPLRPSIIWADQRAQKQSFELENYISQKDFYHIVGHRNTASYGIQKLMWIKENEPEIYEQTYKVLNAKDYIVFKLTGEFCTEYSDANSMACFDINKLKWSEQLIDYAKIDGDKLPKLFNSIHIGGYVTKEASQLTGLAEGTPVVLGGGDGVVANIGCGSISSGKTYCCMGTSAWIATTSEKPIFDESMRTVTWAHAVPGLYAPNGTMQYAGGAYNWVKETICQYECFLAKQNNSSPHIYMDEEIKQSKIGSNGVVFLPYLLGERAPRWNPNARGSWLGLKPENTKGDILRSVLEGITMNLSICLDILRTQVDINEILVIGGGAQNKIWRQIMADVFNANIKVPTPPITAGSMGAAVIGGVGTGIFKDFTAINKFISINSEHTPCKSSVEEYKYVKDIFNTAYFSLESLYEKMSRRI